MLAAPASALINDQRSGDLAGTALVANQASAHERRARPKRASDLSDGRPLLLRQEGGVSDHSSCSSKAAVGVRPLSERRGSFLARAGALLGVSGCGLAGW